jgi:hypothetical protein
MPLRPATVLLWLAAACSAAEPPTAPDALPLDPAMPPTEDGNPPVQVNGRFRGLTSYHATGTVDVVFDNGTATITLGEDVRFSSVPGPVLYLNTTDDANTGQALRIAALESSSGPARFTVAVDPTIRYSRVLIWCDPFNVGVGAASLAPPPPP